tara:strand:+ start:1480 stop:2697 length:1218 start_codon:yes stop_codon:yes gene_type:complete
MARKIAILAAIGAAISLGGCSVIDEGLWPVVMGEDPEPVRITRTQEAQPAASLAVPAEEIRSEVPIASAQTREVDALPGAPEVVPLRTMQSQAGPVTGTYVGSKISSLSGELNVLKATLSNQNNEFQALLNTTTQNSQRYHAIIAAISARLQIGTTPGNPVLNSQWQSAQAELDRVFQDTSRLSELSNRVAANSALANYLVEATRAAFGIQGAVDEDHRQLSVLEDDVSRTVVSIDRLLNEVNETIARQNNYATAERRNLTALALAISNGEAFGPNLSTFAFNEAVRLAHAPSGPPGSVVAAGPGTRLPLVVIRFDQPNVEYQGALYAAVSQAIERRPSALFDVVAVTPNRGGPSEVASSSGAAKKSAEKVMRALLAMGLPATRLNLSSSTSEQALANEVRVYIR